MTFLSFLIDCVLIGKIRYSNIIFSPAPQGGGVVVCACVSL